MTGLLIGIILVVCFLLVVVILAQNPKGSGVNQFVGGGASQMVGARRAGDIFEKATWYLGATLLAGSLLVNIMMDRSGSQAGSGSPNLERVDSNSSTLNNIDTGTGTEDTTKGGGK